jgi:hypothetical protein
MKLLGILRIVRDNSGKTFSSHISQILIRTENNRRIEAGKLHFLNSVAVAPKSKKE